MRGTGLIHCACCGLEQGAALDVQDGGVAAVWCTRCAAHRGESVEQLAARQAEHVAMLERALLDAQDDAVLARGERDHFRDRMQLAYSSRELLVRVLAQIDEAHHMRGTRCACGRRGCRVVGLLADPRIVRMIRSYGEQQRVLRELRNANPDAWTDRWDYIDVSVVYPEPPRRARGGRHRRTG